TKTQVKEINDKPESPGYLNVLADQAGVIAENDVVSSQKQQDDALEAKESSKVDEDDSFQEQTEIGHASKGNEDGENDEDGERDNEDEGDDEDGKGDNEDGDDTDEKTTTANDKIEEENDENLHSTPTKVSSSGRDPRTTSTEIVVKYIRYENYNLQMLMDVHGDLEGDIA
ncbi:hypothetical protein HAX54_029856, partial [Datura stramonium]|nr:hypothetical protein [Datura stramonium]